MAKKIACLCEQFFKFSGEDSLYGGGERWWVDFVALLKKLGYIVDCYQFSTKTWAKRYKKMSIKGLGNISGIPSNVAQDYLNGYDKFLKLNKDADGIFLLSMNLSMRTAQKPTLTVSHGLVGDGMMPGQRQDSIRYLDSIKKWIRNATHTVSVDSNTVKVMQSWDRRVADNMSYIPNYVYLDVFKPIDREPNEKFTVLFPRRLQWCRGYTTMMAAVDILRKKYPGEMKFIFCGRGNEAEEKHFNTWLESNPEDVEYLWKDMSDMASVYQMADISCIPTIMAEGTSLSCLESLASGVPPIVTCVGGLPDLVFNNVNGLLIMPDNNRDYNNPEPTSLVYAIEHMYQDREHLAEMRENGLRMIKAFSKERWDEEMSFIIQAIYGEV